MWPMMEDQLQQTPDDSFTLKWEVEFLRNEIDDYKNEMDLYFDVKIEAE